jgi:predicted  nucleic acid-binding Zn-ribbon protein
MPGLQSVYQLQCAELERADAARKLQEAERSLGESAELRRARQALEGEEAKLSQLRTRLRDLELELEGLNDKIAEGEERLYGGQVRNPKELENLQEELRSLRSRRDHLEDSILHGLDDSEESEKRLGGLRAGWEKVQAAWQAQQGGLTGSVAELKAQLARLDERIAHLRAIIPAPLLDEYDDLCRKKGGRGIAAIRNGLCEGCRVAVPTGMVQQVRRGDTVIRCGNCGRILWME